jgi:hypothetical protein
MKRPPRGLRLISARLICSLVVVLLAACGGDEPERAPAPLADPLRISGDSLFPAGCSTPQAGGVRYRGSEVEPFLTVNPALPDHLVAAWQQDRWREAGADGLVAAVSRDGGRSWTTRPIPFTRCGAGGGIGGDYDRATDPWLAFSADGATVYQIGLAFDASRTGRKAILVSRSTDGGLTWSAPHPLTEEASLDLVLDKPSITADPVDPGRVYAVWDRLTAVTSNDPALQTGPAWFSGSPDGGATWTPPVVVHDPGADAQTIASQILVLPDGTLVDVFVRITRASSDAPSFDLMSSRSPDHGVTWLAPVLVQAMQPGRPTDPRTGHLIRTGDVVPSSAVDPATGAIHVVWEDARFSAGARKGIVRATSMDGGLTWSAPAQVNGAPQAVAFRPALAVGSGGTLAVTYYDLRNDLPSDGSHTWTTFWLATSTDGGASWRDAPLGGPFDLRGAPDVDGWFLGDYTGLAPVAGGFVALFAMSGASTDLFLAR